VGGENRDVDGMSAKMNRNIKKPVIGIVGGVGAGKSTVSAELAVLGCRVLDADALGHEMLRDEAVASAIRQRWGGGMFGPDGQVDRGALGGRVFADPAELSALNAIMHPPMRREMERLVEAWRSDAAVPAVVLDAAVLFEAGWDDLCTHLVFVETARRQRVMRTASRGWDDATLAVREKMQIPLDKKRSKCDYLIQNSSGVSSLREQVRTLYHRIVHAAG